MLVLSPSEAENQMGWLSQGEKKGNSFTKFKKPGSVALLNTQHTGVADLKAVFLSRPPQLWNFR